MSLHASHTHTRTHAYTSIALHHPLTPFTPPSHTITPGGIATLVTSFEAGRRLLRGRYRGMAATTSASGIHFAALSTLVFLEGDLQSQLELAKSRSSLGEGLGIQPMSSPMHQVRLFIIFHSFILAFFLAFFCFLCIAVVCYWCTALLDPSSNHPTLLPTAPPYTTHCILGTSTGEKPHLSFEPHRHLHDRGAAGTHITRAHSADRAWPPAV